MSSKYILGDIHNKIKDFKDNSIDLIYTNPPYATTSQKWDKPLKWDELFIEMWRVLKPNGTIILHSAIPFSYELYKYETPKYNYIWKKNNPTGFFHAKYQPLRDIEEINIYYKKRGTYNPQMIEGKPQPQKICHSSSEYYGQRKPKQFERCKNQIGLYPRTYLGKYSRVLKKGGKSVPEKIIIQMIKTYSNEGDLILDMTHHNEYVGDIAISLKRNYIGVDIQPKFLKTNL